MKKFLFFFVIFVFSMTFMLTRTKTVKVEGYTVTQEEADNYKNNLIEKYNISEEQAEKCRNYYVESMTSEPYEKIVKGESFKDALIFSSVVYIVGYIILFIIFHIKNIHYNELYGSNRNDSLSGWRRFFF